MLRIALGSMLLLVAASAQGRAQEREAISVAVVVGVSSRIPALDADTVRDLFLRRRTLLPDGARAVPINLPVGNDARERFSALVLGRKPADLTAYWDRLYFDGVRPPIVLPSAEAVRRYVQVDERAIGYLAVDEVDETVRVIVVFPPTNGGRFEAGRR